MTDLITDGNFKIGFIGLGLIGGSIAKAIKQVHPEYTITAYDTDLKGLAAAYDDKVVDITCNFVDDNFSNLDIIFLCAPVKYNIMYLESLKNIIKSSCVLTDVGSVKSDIHEKIHEYSLEANFVGGHPMAGSERFGYANSHDKLLENAYYIITPSDMAPSDMIDKVFKIVEAIGAIPLIIDYKTHDYVTAAISHLPHIIASGLVNLVMDSDDDSEYMRSLAAGGFKDITRIASSSPNMWQQICLSNSYYIKSMLNKYIDYLTQVRDAINNNDDGYLYDFFDSAREYREMIPNTSIGVIKRIYHIFVDIVDESGAIATIAAMLADNEINIKNIGIVHNREFCDGVLRIEFYNEISMSSAINLFKKHNYTVYER